MITLCYYFVDNHDLCCRHTLVVDINVTLATVPVAEHDQTEEEEEVVGGNGAQEQSNRLWPHEGVTRKFRGRIRESFNNNGNHGTCSSATAWAVNLSEFKVSI